VNWYYVEKGRRAGPVPQESLVNLVKEGVVRLDTLVWREGMEQWKPLGEVSGTDPAIHEMIQAALAGALGAGGEGAGHPTDPNWRGQASSETVHVLAGPGESYCAECRRVFATNDMIPFGEQWVCADCKPLFFQRIREGVQPAPVLRYAGFWVRLLAVFADGIAVFFIYFVAMIFFSLVVAVSIGSRTAPQETVAVVVGLSFFAMALAIPMLYESLFTGRFGATLGKMLCGLRVVRPDGASITYGRSFGRYFAKCISYLTFYIGFIIAAFDGQKRALHDHICSTRVVRKG
jgi:uncharacterized RDD family membrane protein YckC